LFAGIGGIDLGLERAGMVCKWQVEIDPFCQEVLTKHWPSIQKYGDIKDVGRHNLEAVDLICGGFPCQPFSYSGREKGITDARWLWPEFARVVSELRPRYAFMENVPGLLHHGMGLLLADLASLGYDAEWDCIPARTFGTWHNRDRAFIVAYTQYTGCGRSRESQPECQCQEVGRGEQYRGNGSYRVMAGTIDTLQAWATEPRISRVGDGVPSRMDRNRIRAIGNAVVPQVAEWIGRRVLEFEALEASHRNV
jgi:DNA (cytosine-5)-methyltransferase 1